MVSYCFIFMCVKNYGGLIFYMKEVDKMNELYHYGVKGMKWGVRKEVYNSSSRSRKKEIRKEYYKTPEGRIKKATTIGTILGGPLVGIVAGSITARKIEKEVGAIKNNKLSSVDNKVIEKGRKKVEALSNNGKIETDEQKIKRLMSEGKTNPKSNYIFDQNGNLMMVYWGD